MPTMKDSLYDDAEGAIKAIPELYKDGFQPTIKESGQTLALIPKAVNAALVPLRKWIAEREYCLAETEKLLAAKLENIPADKITTPDGYVGVPALQAISYSMDSNELRELYANLLANAMNIDTKSKVHPSFVELIKQMSPNDANVFKIIYEAPITPLLDLYINIEPKDGNVGGNREFIYNITWIKELPYEDVAISIDNLLRLGLIKIPFGSSYTHKPHYEKVKANPEYIQLKNQLEALRLGKVESEEKIIRKTALADSFFEICVKGIAS